MAEFVEGEIPLGLEHAFDEFSHLVAFVRAVLSATRRGRGVDHVDELVLVERTAPHSLLKGHQKGVVVAPE